MLELERKGVENYIAHRQVIRWNRDLWIVLDSTSGPSRSRTTTTWTTPSDVEWQQRQNEGQFLLKNNHTGAQLSVFFLGPPAAEQKLFHGSLHPFAGWQIEGGVPVASSALVIEQPADKSWAATVWSWKKAGAAVPVNAEPRMTRWASATDWEMQLPSDAGIFALRREGNFFRFHSDRETEGVLELTSPLDVKAQLAELHSQFALTASRHRRFWEDSAKRTKVTYLLFAIFLLQELFFVLYKRVRAPYFETLRYLDLMTWIAGGIWLVGFYF